MYYLFKLQSIVRIPPERFKEPLKKTAFDVLCRTYEGIVDRDLGIVLAVIDVKVSNVGRILPGDGASFHQTEFGLLTFNSSVQELVEGEVTDVTNFGLFVRLGPVEGLVHLSQIIDDYLTHDPRHSSFHGKETRRSVGKGDVVRARVVSVGASQDRSTLNIGLTMRQPFLGKLQWIEEDITKATEGEKVPKTAPEAVKSAKA